MVGEWEEASTNYRGPVVWKRAQSLTILHMFFSWSVKICQFRNQPCRTMSRLLCNWQSVFPIWCKDFQLVHPSYKRWGTEKIFHWTQTHSQQTWNQGVQIDRDILANKPGIIIQSKKLKPTYHWIPSDWNVIKKRLKIYKNLSIETQWMWNIKCTLILVTTGPTEIVTKELTKSLEIQPGATAGCWVWNSSLFPLTMLLWCFHPGYALVW